MNLKRNLWIYILRTAEFTVIRVTELVKCSPSTVKQAENWIQECTYSQACDLVNDTRIQRQIEQDLRAEMTDEERDGMRSVIAADILLRYNRFPSDDVGYDPARTLALEDHWKQLRDRAAALHDELEVPATENLIPLDMCRHIIRARRMRHSVIPADRWRVSIDSPWLLSRPRGTGDTQVRLPVETQILFPALRVHLTAELLEFDPVFVDWKSHAGQLVGLCLAQAVRITRKCAKETGLRYIGGTVHSGLLETASAYICRMMLASIRTVPRWDVTTADEVTWRLVPQDLPAWGLATGRRDRLDQCAEQLGRIISGEMENPVWQDIIAQRGRLTAHGTILQEFLQSVIARGTFTGSCSWCPASRSEEAADLG